MRAVFNYSRFEKLVEEEVANYQRAHPYPFGYFDGLFEERVLDDVIKEIRERNFHLDSRKDEGIQVKVRSAFADNEELPPACRECFQILNGGKFMNLLTKLTGVDGLIPDLYYDGGGINIIENGGSLAVHVDGTHQRRMKVCRRLNAILFLNNDWDPSWNGYHEQWMFQQKDLDPFDPNQEWKCVRKILPKRNRLFIFTTNDHSFHGHAGALNVPEGVERLSLITYYYTVTRPPTDLVFEQPHAAKFIHNKITLQNPVEAFKDTEVIL